MNSQSRSMLEDHDLPSCMRKDEPSEIAIPTEEILLRELDRLRLLEPRVAILRCEDGVKLEFGIGGTWMYLRIYRPEVGRLPFIYLPEDFAPSPPIAFSYEGQPHEIGPKFLLPAKDALKLIQQVYLTEQIPAGFVSEYGEQDEAVATKSNLVVASAT